MNITSIKSTYGYIGFIPFAILSLAPWVLGGEIAKISIQFQLAYGSIIITFLGGFAWGWPDDQKNQALNLSYGIGFSLLGCSMLLLTYFGFIMTALILAIISFYLFYLFEKSTVIFDTKDDDYQRRFNRASERPPHQANETRKKSKVNNTDRPTTATTNQSAS